MKVRQGVRKGLVLLLLLPAAAVAGGLQQVVSTASDSAAAGDSIDVQVAWLNHREKPARVDVPERISCTLSSDDRLVEGVLFPANAAAAGAVSVPPGGFHSVRYRLRMPADLKGVVLLRIEGASAAAIAVAEAGGGASPAAAGAAEEDDGRGAGFKAYFADNFYGYEPMYFLYGPEPENARFQLSLKYRILNTAGPLTRRWSALQGLFFGYTQTSFWDLDAASKPFEDTSYKPEVFYLRQVLPLGDGAAVQRFDLQGGLQHESNGRGGPDSRSLNIAYIRPTWVFGDDGGYRLTVSPKIWTYIGDLSENPDIYRYRGYFDLHLDYGRFDGWKVASILRKGAEGANGSLQLDVSYPLSRVGFQNLDFFLYGQFFTGHGETLLHYDRYDTRFRIGLGVYR